ncbi:hypothetical protein [Streptomyces sp. NPDC058228]
MWTETNVLGRDGLAGVRQDGLLAFVRITPGLMIRGCWVARPKPWEVDDELWAVIEPRCCPRSSVGPGIPGASGIWTGWWLTTLGIT